MAARASASVASEMRKVMADLAEQEGPLARLEVKDKIGEGGYGVVHLGE